MNFMMFFTKNSHKYHGLDYGNYLSFRRIKDDLARTT